MKHIKNLAIKFISICVVLFIILGLFYEMSFGNVLTISIVLTLAAYLIGDMFLLFRTNNTMATIADFGLAFLIIWLLGENLTHGDSLMMPSLISAVCIALFEIFFHKYVSRQMAIANENHHNRTGNLRYQTEASRELSPKNTDIYNQDDNEQ